ncbi:hypothetical protein [Methanopyrus sp.]
MRILPLIPVVLVILPAATHAGCISVTVYPESVSTQGNALGLHERLEKEIDLTVTVTDLGTGAVYDLRFNPLDPSSPAGLDVTGPAVVIATIRYAGNVVSRFNVWPEGASSFSSVEVSEGRLEMTVNRSRVSVPSKGTFEVECPITMSLRTDKGTVTVKLMLHVSGTGVKGVEPERKRILFELPSLVRLIPMAAVLVPMIVIPGVILVDVTLNVLSGLKSVLEPVLNQLLSVFGGAPPRPGQR